MDRRYMCPSIYQDLFSNPFNIERYILIIYFFIFIIGLIGNIMTITIIKYNAHLRTPTNFYLLNLAVSDLMMLLCNLPLEMMEIYNREWPLPVIFCQLRNICAEFFTCSSILTIVAFTCERYFTIVRPIHFHRLSHFRRAQNIIIIIWLISLGFSLPLGLAYEVRSHSIQNTTLTINHREQHLHNACKSCVQKKTIEKYLSIIIIITSFCFFYFPIITIGAIYLFIGKTLRRMNTYDLYSNQLELSSLSQSSLSTKDVSDMCRLNSYSRLKMRARYHARQVVIKTLVAVVIAFFVCYAPLYLQRLFVAIMTINSNMNIESSFLFYFMAHLYIVSGVTFYFGSSINPILYNILSNKYRRAFRDLLYCRLQTRKRSSENRKKTAFSNNRLEKRQIHYCIKQQSQENRITYMMNICQNNNNQQIKLNEINKSHSSDIFSY